MISRSLPRRCWAVFGLLAATTAPLAGQATAIRERRGAAERFADTVAATTDRDVLSGFERELLLRARRERTNPAVHYRLGILALAQDQPRDAAAELKWATQLDPQWAAAWFGLGQAEHRMGELADTTEAGRRALLARDAWARAIAAYARSVQLDSTLASRLEHSAANRPAAASTTVYRDALRRLLQGPSRSQSHLVAVASGRVERLLGDTTQAIAAFDYAASLAAGPSLGLLESARTKLTSGRTDGVDGYFRAAAALDSATITLLRSDLGWIATADELNRFDRAPADDRGQIVWRFWATRDRSELRGNTERLIEHYRRLAAAPRRFPNPDDQRVAVFVRHGEPENRASLRLPQLDLNETWRYRRPEGDLVVHFAAGADTTNYRVVESLFDLVGDRRVGAPAGDERIGSVDLSEALLRSRAQLSPFYQAAAAGRRDQLDQFRVRERELGRAARNLALTTDRFPLRFARDLPARFAFLGRASDSGAIEVVFSIPTFGLDSADATRPVRLRISAWNRVTEAAYAFDSLLLTRVGGRSGGVAGVARLSVPKGSYAVRTVLETGSGRGAFGGDDEVSVVWGAFGGDDEVSVGPSAATGAPRRVAFGVEGVDVSVGGGGPVDPGGQFNQADTVVAWLDLEKPVDPTRVRVRVRPVTTRGEVKWRDYPGIPSGAAVVVGSTLRVSLPLRRLSGGIYEVEIGVEGSISEASLRRGRFEVIAAEK